MVTLRALVLVTLMVLSLQPFEGHCKKAGNKNKKTAKKKASSKLAPTAKTFVGKYKTTDCIEYEELNGWMTPKTAKRLCDEDLACAGFTYKGANGLQQKFHIKFFHYIPKTVEEEAKINGDWSWTSYKVPRPFVLWPIAEQKVKSWKSAEKSSSNKEVNPILGVQFKLGDEVDLKDFLPDPKIQSSQWMTVVSLNTSLYLTNNCVDQTHEKDYIKVKEVPCGHNLTAAILTSEPVIFSTEDCLATCRKDNSQPIFDHIHPHSSWTHPQNGKSIKRENVKRDALFKAHLRAIIHDRSAPAIKSILINGDDLAPFGHEEDLATKLSLRRSSQLFFDYWKKGHSGTITLSNPPGTSVTYFYVQGDEPMEWLLIPTNTMSEMEALKCKEGSIVKPSLTIHGKAVQKAVLRQGEMIYVPSGWSYQVQNKAKEAVTIAEARLTQEAIEEVAISMGEQEIYALKKALENPFWHLWRRFSEILRQRRRRKH